MKASLNRYETPAALRHDSELVVDEARALLDATTKIADEKVTEARRRLESALSKARDTYGELKEGALEKAQHVDGVIRRHPYQSMAVAAGAGALFALLLARRR